MLCTFDYPRQMIRLLLLTPLLMVATMIGAPLLIRAGALSPLGGFGAFMGAWIVAAGSGLLGGVVGALRPETRPLAWAALAAGAALSVSLLVVALRAQGAPLHDISTDLDDPPSFTVATSHPDNAGRDLSYPHGDPDSAELQRRYYPDLQHAVWCDVEHRRIWRLVVAAAESMDWNITWMNTADMVIEAEATTPVFRFVDDIVIRVHSPNGGCVHVDTRSTSRVGRSDLGANAARIADFQDRLVRLDRLAVESDF